MQTPRRGKQTPGRIADLYLFRPCSSQALWIKRTILGEAGPEREGQGEDHAGTALLARSAVLIAMCCPVYKQPPLHRPCQLLSLLYPAPRALGTLPLTQLGGKQSNPSPAPFSESPSPYPEP